MKISARIVRSGRQDRIETHKQDERQTERQTDRQTDMGGKYTDRQVYVYNQLGTSVSGPLYRGSQ